MKPLLYLLALACSATNAPQSQASPVSPTQQEGLHMDAETYRLPNGMTIVLLQDNSLPKVVIDTWFAVGSKDEEPGRTGFAHLFEHLMFMGTGRVPDNQFDVIMESGGGSNNASTSNDSTNYFSQGPSSLLPTLLWLDADRLEALPDHMTQEKLDSQRAIVRNERRQQAENMPYGKGYLLLSKSMYPEGHPYHHSVIGSHEDLEAATLQDVIDFFHKHYVPGNATLVVAGDFQPEEIKPLIASTFGSIPAKELPARVQPEPVELSVEKFVRITDKVQFPKIGLSWHSPAYYTSADGAMDLIATLLADGSSSRLHRRLVQETALAQSVHAIQDSAELGSVFTISAIANAEADLEAIKAIVLEELALLIKDGPEPAELARIKTSRESDYLRSLEGLLARAEDINASLHFFGVADGSQRNLERWTLHTPKDISRFAGEVFGAQRVDMRIVPEDSQPLATALDERPSDFAPRAFTPPAPSEHMLSNGLKVYLLETPGTQLFAGSVNFRGGESLVAESAQAGLASLTAEMLNSGAGGRDKASYAQALEALGASIHASAYSEGLSVSVEGLKSRQAETLDLLRDMLLAPNFTEGDLKLNVRLAEASIKSRQDNPSSAASDLLDELLYGPGDARGRYLGGSEVSMQNLGANFPAKEVLLKRFTSRKNASLIFVGDFDAKAFLAELDARLGQPYADGQAEAPLPAAVDKAFGGQIVLLDRPGAPQTVIRILRPLSASIGAFSRADYDAVDTVFGGTFTSRLNANLREDKGYTYGASSRIRGLREQRNLVAGSAVRTDVTAASLSEFKLEFEAMAAHGISADELEKAVKTLQGRLVEGFESTSSRQASLQDLWRNGRALNSIAADIQALEDVTLESANRFARSGAYDWNRVVVLMVGDKQAVLPQLEAAGFPQPEIR